MRKFASLAAVALGALACSSAFAQTSSTPAAPPVNVDPEPMVFGGWGVNPADLDPNVDPGDDFFAYVNGKWEAQTEIPPQLSYYGAVTNLRLGAERDVRAIVEDLAKANPAPGSLEQRIGDAYASYLDTAAIDAAGLTPAFPYINRINAVASTTDLLKLFAEPGYPSPFGGGVSIDRVNPQANTMYFGIGGYGLPDRDYYLVDSPKNLEIRAKYKEYLTFLLGKAGYADAKGTADAVYDLERQMAAADWDRAVARNPELTTNKLDRAGLLALAGDFPFDTYLQASGLGAQNDFTVFEVPPTPAKIKAIGLTPAQLAKLGGGMPALFKLIANTPLPNWQAWMTAQFLSNNASVLPTEIDDASFAFYGTTLQGRQVKRERWRRAVGAVEGSLGEAVGKIYVERHFPASSKAAMVELVNNLRLAMADNLSTLDWMTPATRLAAKAKLDAFNVKIGYPDKFETYDGLVIKRGAPLENAIAAGAWQWQKDLKDLTKPVDKAKWLMTPQTVNAYYMPPANEIVFPAAYLQAPNFSPTADMAVNYGAVGSTIGHEIGHGFDDNGAKYDGTGTLRNWWSDADRATFQKLGDKLAKQYDSFCPYDEGKTCINGRLTLGENIGDLGGISMAYKAYKIALGGKEAPIIDGLTGDQRFFISYAQAHRSEWREAMLRQIMQTDPHSPDVARVNFVLRNFDPWYKAFNVTPDDKLYLPPSERVRIW